MTDPAESGVVTFGCRLNILESEAIRRAVSETDRNDLVVVNTCAVTGEAVRQARQTIRRLVRSRPGTEIAVTGCAAQIDPASFEAIPGVGRIVGNNDKARPDAWRRDAVGLSPGARPVLAPPPAVDGFTGHTRGFVAVQNGCDHSCTFCIIPLGRGRSRSQPVSDVIEAVRRLTRGGCREIVLTGVDITAWGADLDGSPRLGTLVRAILRAVPELARLRLSSIDVAEVDDNLLAVLAGEERLMPHLHLSLQAGDDLILKRMKRRHSRAEAQAFCDKVRDIRPDVAFGADLIAGFPTESEDHFASSLSLVEECGISYLHVFPFSPRPETPAARMPQPGKSLVRERAARLREAGARALRRHLDARIGRTLTVLAERDGRGHAEDFTTVDLPAGTAPGTILNVEAASHDGTRMQVEPAPALGGAAGTGYAAA